jgi:hypothetical protein
MTKAIAYYKNGSVVTYKYDGNSEYKGEIETEEERATRQLTCKTIEKFEIVRNIGGNTK